MVYPNHKSCSFRVRRGVPQGYILGPVLFSLFINDLHPSLPSSISCFLYADDLAIWPSSPSVPTAMEATLEILIQLECWSEYWCLPLNPSKCEASFFLVNPYQAHLQSHLFLFNSSLRFNPTPTFFRAAFDRTISFSKHVFSLKAKFFPRLKALHYISISSLGPSKESLSLLYKAILRLLLTYASPGWFPSLSVTNVTKLECLQPSGRSRHNQLPLVLPYPTSHLRGVSNPPPPLQVTLTHFNFSSYERVLRLPTSFPISGLARLGVTLQTVLESFCIPPPAHASFYFS